MATQENQNLLSRALAQYNEVRRRHLENLKELVRIPSVSFDGFPASEVRRSAEAVAALLRKTGLERVEILEVEGAHPYVYGEWMHAPGRPTLLLYAHHDVQPPGKLELWKTGPFDPVEKDGRLYGRGTADDKAGIVVHTATIESFLTTAGKLPVNVRLVIEGEEESGSSHLTKFLDQYRDRLKADVMVLTDTQNYDKGFPALTVSLRGLAAMEVEVRALKQSVHSGMFGGPVPDPALALCKMLATVTDSEGRITVPGVWDQVKELSKSDEAALSELPFSIPEFRSHAGLLAGTRVLPTRDGTVHPLKGMWREPAFSVNAFEASARKAAANVINASAWAKIGIRLVPGMDPEKTLRLLQDHLRRVAPWGVEVEFKSEAASPAWETKTDHPVFAKAAKALEAGYGRKPALMGCGGTIPFVGPFGEALGGAPALLIGVEDPYTYAHSENESMPIADFEACIRSMIHFYCEL